MSHAVLRRPGAPDIAYVAVPGADAALPTVIFMGGYRSDMAGTKALFLEETCRARGQGFVRFDYRGHGQSGGDFEEACIGDWLDDALVVCGQVVPAGDMVIVGSSMGGWIGLLAARELGPRVRGFVGVAAAPDFTRGLNAGLTEADREMLRTRGRIERPNDYGPDAQFFTAKLLAEGEAHGLLDTNPHYPGQIRLLHGMKDADVPWQVAFRIRNAVTADGGVVVTLVENGDHRLSNPEELALLDRQVQIVSGIAEDDSAD
jgi:pimeloyl-ACP methyl ester carboxylesterase